MRMSDEGMSESWMRRRKTESTLRRRPLSDCSGGRRSPYYPRRRRRSCRRYCRAGEVKTAAAAAVPPGEPSRRKRRKRKHCGTFCVAVGEYCGRTQTRSPFPGRERPSDRWAATERCLAGAVAASRPGGRDIASRARRQQSGARQRATTCPGPPVPVRWASWSWPPR